MKPTKEQIFACNDEQQLIDWVAEVCMGWHLIQYYLGCAFDQDHYVNDELMYQRDIKDWQPCSNTEKGKAQCWDLAEKYELELDFVLKCARYDNKETELTYEVHAGCMQIAVAKAALISELGE